MARHHDDLLKTFSDEQREIFERFDDCWSEYASLAEEAIFVYAFRLGAQMTLNALHGGGEWMHHFCFRQFIVSTSELLHNRKGNAIAFPFLLAGAEGFEKSRARQSRAVANLQSKFAPREPQANEAWFRVLLPLPRKKPFAKANGFFQWNSPSASEIWLRHVK